MKTFIVKKLVEVTQIVEAESREEVEKCFGLITYHLIKQDEKVISKEVKEVVPEYRVVEEE